MCIIQSSGEKCTVIYNTAELVKYSNTSNNSNRCIWLVLFSLVRFCANENVKRKASNDVTGITSLLIQYQSKCFMLFLLNRIEVRKDGYVS